MRDPEERSASLALRDGGPAPVRRAVELVPQPRAAAHRGPGRHGRRRPGRLPRRHRRRQGRPAGLRHHRDGRRPQPPHPRRNRRPPTAPTVTAARGHRIGVGDVILTRRNDPTIDVCDATDIDQDRPIRCATATAGASTPSTPTTNRIAARRLDDGARTVFDGDYLREHVTSATRSPCTPPRASPPTPPTPCSANHQPQPAVRRDDPRPRHQQRLPLRTHDPEADIPQGASDSITYRHGAAAATPLRWHTRSWHVTTNRPPRIRSRRARRASCCPVCESGRLVARHHQAAAKWRAAHDEWRSAVAEFTAGMARSRERSFARSRARDRSRDEGLEL